MGCECDIFTLITRLFPETAKLFKLTIKSSLKKKGEVFTQAEELLKLMHSPTLQLVSDYWQSEENQKNEDFELFIQTVSQLVKALLLSESCVK